MTASGIVVVDKPGGMTSHDVVGRVRRALGTRKVGHAGTLDPMATGVLVIGVERATRLLGHLALRDKRYLATMRLGSTTVTDDAEGEHVSSADPGVLAAVTDDEVSAALQALVGRIAQRPSAVSAVKVAGRRAYDRVRAGEDVELEPRQVEITRMDVIDVRRSGSGIDVDLDVECSTGTYVRAIARDVGAALGVGGHLTALRRTRVGTFGIDQAVNPEEVDESAIVPMSDVAATSFPVWRLASDEEASAVTNGRRIPWAGPAGPPAPVAVLDAAGDFLALAQDEDGLARYLAVFVTPRL